MSPQKAARKKKIEVSQLKVKRTLEMGEQTLEKTDSPVKLSLDLSDRAGRERGRTDNNSGHQSHVAKGQPLQEPKSSLCKVF
jgi:hypothetical protein